MYDLARVIDGNAPDDAKVTVTVSLDDQWMVRYLDVEVDHASVLEHSAKADAGTRYPYRLTMDLISTTDKPATITIPIQVVDAPVDDPTTTVTP